MLNRRAEKRTTSPDFARLLLGPGRNLPCRVLDRSASGVRLSVHGEPSVPDSLTLEMLSTGEVCALSVMWRGKNEIGAMIVTAGGV